MKLDGYRFEVGGMRAKKSSILAGGMYRRSTCGPISSDVT
jgi:hypothetical protein